VPAGCNCHLSTIEDSNHGVELRPDLFYVCVGEGHDLRGGAKVGGQAEGTLTRYGQPISQQVWIAATEAIDGLLYVAHTHHALSAEAL
jgi:hypothetical protein